MITCSKDRVQNLIETFAKFGDAGHGGVTRFTLSDEEIQARVEFTKRMEAIGAKVELDDLANMYATIEGTDATAPRIVMASHADSVRNGGNYDGILGVLTGMEVLETIVKEKIEHKHPVTAMMWTNEEGSLYPPAMMVSGIICGKFDEATMLASKSIDGETFEEALDRSGYRGDRANRLNATDYRAMVELHIEQGPVLEAEKKEIGIVEGVVGMVNYRIRTYGQSDHAGTTPMPYRQDALLAATSAIRYLHDELDKLDSNLVYTTGEIVCHPNVHTVIPDFVDFSIDSRHQDPEVIKQVVEVINNIPKELDKCEVKTELAWARNTVQFDETLVGYVEKAAADFGYSAMRMYSGAGHDAQYITDLMPSTMVFAPSKDGHSHCEDEFTTVEECWKAMNIVLQTVLDIDKN